MFFIFCEITTKLQVKHWHANYNFSIRTDKKNSRNITDLKYKIIGYKTIKYIKTTKKFPIISIISNNYF